MADGGFMFEDDEREEWADDAEAALLLAAAATRGKISKKLSGKRLPARARNLWRQAWWEAEVDGTLNPAFSAIAAQASNRVDDEFDLGLEDAVKAAAVGYVVGSALQAIAGYGAHIRERVLDLHKQAVDDDWDPDRLSTELGLDGDGGPLSDALVASMGRSLATTITEGSATGTLGASDRTGEKTWRSMGDSRVRDAHEDADGQTVGINDDFDIDGHPAAFPGDPRLPDDLSIGCRCSVEYTIEPVEEEDDVDEEALAATGAPDLVAFAVDPGRVTVTVEPTSAEKQALALVADDAAQLHVPLLDVTDVAALTPDTRIAIGTALANVSATVPPLSGTISGVGWLPERGVTVGIVDCPGLSAARAALADALYDIAPEPGEFLPAVVLTSGSVDATSIAGMPVHFNELRLRVGAETLVFDLLGPVPGAPDPQLAEPETAPSVPDEPVIEPAPEETPPMPTTTAVAAEFADSPGDIPTDAPPAPLLADVPDGDLEAEIARRAAQVAADNGAGTVEELITAAEAEAAGVIGEIADDLTGESETPAEDTGEPMEPMEMAADGETFAEDGDLVPDEDPAGTGEVFDWNGIIAFEGVPTSDGRMFAEDSLVWRTLPLSLALQTATAPGHDGAVVCGSMCEITRVGEIEVARVGNAIVSRGRLSATEAGQLARTLLEERSIKGVSVDIASASVVYTDENGDEVTEDDLWAGDVAGAVMAVFVHGEIMGATLTAFPAFSEATVELCETTTLVASATDPGRWTLNMPAHFQLGNDTEALVASAGSTIPAPSADLFNLRPDTTEPWHVGKPLPDGTIPCYGVIAYWGECHIGFDGKCVTPPTDDDFSAFYVGSTVLTAEGTLIPTGVLFMDTVHPDLRKSASDAQAHYADTGCAVADVRLYNGEHGIVAAGVLRPDVDDITAYRLRGSRVSGDWRPTRRGLRMAAILAVNAGGFGRKPIVEGIAASAGRLRTWALLDDQGEVTAMVAAGTRSSEPTPAEYQADLEARLAALEDRIEAMGEPVLLEVIETDDGPVELSADERVNRAKAAMSALGVPTRDERVAAARASLGLCDTCDQ